MFYILQYPALQCLQMKDKMKYLIIVLEGNMEEKEKGKKNEPDREFSRLSEAAIDSVLKKYLLMLGEKFLC